MSFKYKENYGNFIGGKFVEPVSGKYFDNISPVDGAVLCQVARSDEKDIELALDAAHAGKRRLGCDKRYRTRFDSYEYRAGDGR